MRTPLLIVMVTTLALLSFAGSASAYYNPTVGRWITRDPAGNVDGPNTYQYVKSAPVSRTDPTGQWGEVERKGKERAKVCSNDPADTWQSLAEKVLHDEDEHQLWVKDEQGNAPAGKPEIGRTYTVPNKVIVDYGSPSGFWDRFGMQTGRFLGIDAGIGSIGVVHLLADAFAAGARQGGKMVVQNRGMIPGTADLLAQHMADPDLWAYAYAGHGAGDGILVYSFTPQGKYVLGPDRYVHHRIAHMMLFACKSLEPTRVGVAFWNPETTGGRSAGFSLWEQNVSKYGSLWGYKTNVRSADLSVGGNLQILPGGLRRNNDRGPDPVPPATLDSD